MENMTSTKLAFDDAFILDACEVDMEDVKNWVDYLTSQWNRLTLQAPESLNN